MTLARSFYGELLGLKEGRRAADDKWQDYSLFGHQLVCHYVGQNYRGADHYNPVDGDEVPVPHFGIVLQENQFHDLAEKLKLGSKESFINCYFAKVIHLFFSFRNRYQFYNSTT